MPPRTQLLRHIRPPPHRQLQRRTFLLPTPQPLTLTATRTLPYSAAALYALIADIPSYPLFLPFCTRSTVTSWSAPLAAPPTAAADAPTRYPRTARLTVGWAGYTESFTSRVFCAPDRIVEAVAGDAVTSIPRADLRHYLAPGAATARSVEEADVDDGTASLFRGLKTRWTLTPTSARTGGARDGTVVDLHIEVRWASALYAALSAAAAPQVAGLMVDAFERRAGDVLGGEREG
jgi:coenzyme Q-binding protein COQ10